MSGGRRLSGTAALSLGLALAGIGALAAGGAPGGGVLFSDAYRDTVIIGDAFPRTLVDPLGISQEMARPPQRIASSVLLGDEILTALVPPDRFVAVTHLIDDPAISNCVDLAPPNAERISSTIETLVRLEPDLVVVADYTRAETVRFLLSLGIPVLRFGRYGSFADVARNVRTAGAAVGADAAAAELVRDMERRLAEVDRRVAGRPKPRVLYFVFGGFTSGRDTLMDEIIERAGGHNVAREAGLRGQAAIPLELAIGLAPEVVFVPDWRPADAPGQPFSLADDPLWQHVPAVQHGRVHVLNSAWTVTLSQYAVHGFEQVARILHPEAFDT